MFEEKKTRLNNMLAQQSSNSSSVGKSTAVRNDIDSNSGDNEAKQDAAHEDDSIAETPTGPAVLTAGLQRITNTAIMPAGRESVKSTQGLVEAAIASTGIGNSISALKSAMGIGGGGGGSSNALSNVTKNFVTTAAAKELGAKEATDATMGMFGAKARSMAQSAQQGFSRGKQEVDRAMSFLSSANSANNTAHKMEGGDGSQTPTPAAPAAPAAGPAKVGAITGAGASPKVNDAISNVAIGETVTYSNTEDGNWFMDGDQIGSGTQIEWTAPNAPGSRNLRFERFLSSPNAIKGSTSKPIMVRAPSKVTFEKLGDLPAAGPDFAGVGMRLKVKVESSDVAFGKVEWLERPGPAEGVTGYFATYGAGRLNHIPAAGGIPMGATNDDVIDAAFSRDKPKLPHPDGTTRWWAGSFSWTVPNVYRIGGTEVMFDTVTQSFSMTDDGTMTVTKGGMSATHKPESQTDGKDVVKFKDVGEAKVYLNPHGIHGIIPAALNYKRQPNADPASVRLLGQALVAYDIRLKTNLTCRTTHDWTGADRVTLTANGVGSSPAAHSINNGEKKTYTFLMNSLLNLSTLDTPSINLAASDKPMSATIGYPYDGLSGAMGDRYSYDCWFAWS